MKSRRYLRAVSSLVALACLVGCAAHDRAVALGSAGNSDSSFCTTLTSRSAAAQTRIDKASQGLTASWQKQNERLALLAAGQDAKVQEARASTDIKRAQNVSSLSAKATNDSERQAVKVYAVTLNQAVQVRQQAVDSAQSHFRSALKSTIQDEQTTQSGQVQALRIAVADAYSIAANSCSGDVGVSTARANLSASLAAIRQHYVAERSADQNIAWQVQQLAASRQATVKTADDTFQATMAEAKQILQTSFGADASRI